MLVCDTCIEVLKVLCYEERVIDRVQVYRVNDAPFNHDEAFIINEFNDVLKQAVLKVDTIVKPIFDSLQIQ